MSEFVDERNQWNLSEPLTAGEFYRKYPPDSIIPLSVFERFLRSIDEEDLDWVAEHSGRI